MASSLVASQNLKARPSCWRHHTFQRDFEKPNWNWPWGLFPTDLLSQDLKILYKLPGRKAINSATQLKNTWYTTETYTARHPRWCNSNTFVLELTNSYLIGLKAYLIGRNQCLLFKPSQLPVARKVIDHRELGCYWHFCKLI